MQYLFSIQTEANRDLEVAIAIKEIGLDVIVSSHSEKGEDLPTFDISFHLDNEDGDDVARLLEAIPGVIQVWRLTLANLVFKPEDREYTQETLQVPIDSPLPTSY